MTQFGEYCYFAQGSVVPARGDEYFSPSRSIVLNRNDVDQEVGEPSYSLRRRANHAHASRCRSGKSASQTVQEPAPDDAPEHSPVVDHEVDDAAAVVRTQLLGRHAEKCSSWVRSARSRQEIGRHRRTRSAKGEGKERQAPASTHALNRPRSSSSWGPMS